LKRIGSNLRPAEPKPQRNLRNIIRYSSEEKPRNDYPKRIISPPEPKACCSDDNREMVGNIREVDGFNDNAVRKYRSWKRYMAH
jgi:hypothetical protein